MSPSQLLRGAIEVSLKSKQSTSETITYPEDGLGKDAARIISVSNGFTYVEGQI